MSNSQLNTQWRVDTGLAPLTKGEFDIYMIIEPELWPQWQTQLYQEVSEPIHIPLFEKTQFANIEQGPVLVALDEQVNMFKLAVERMEATPCGCLLFVKKGTSQDRLSMILRNGLIVMTGKATALLRYYEPRTLLPLLGSMTDEERSLFFQDVLQIYWYQEQWLSARISEIVHPPEPYQWTITPEHISTMQSILTQSRGAV
ncbi:DUF4123 domain-containing protein [Vibrio sp. CJQ_6]|uniref:DUF4123 domain-containing protein n=1 Tax=Vibrio sp. CJQ_6 TaxID=3367165 RepID=UPI00370C4D37